MVWRYSQSTGVLSYNNTKVAIGYAGMGPGRNNPQMERVAFVGPLPRGRYQISAPYRSKNKGPHVMKLDPVGHIAHGRTEFRIHGDSVDNPGNASEGCIILPRHVRERISASGDTYLEVVE